MSNLVPTVRTVATLVAMLLLVAACEGAKDPVVDEDEPGLAEVPVDDRCEDVDEALVAAIAEHLVVDAELKHAYAVESEEEDVTFIAAELEGEGHPDKPPVSIWAIRGDLNADEPEILAVNAIARENSDWPFEEKITEKVEGGEEAKACTNGPAQ